MPINPIPETKDAIVIRTDFADQVAWEAVCAAIRQPVGDFKAYVEFLSDPRYDGLAPEQLRSLVPPDYRHTFLFVVDRLAITHHERPILVIDLREEPGRTFRVVPSEIWGVENNLSIANMDFSEFADAADADGVFRGFAEAERRGPPRAAEQLDDDPRDPRA